MISTRRLAAGLASSRGMFVTALLTGLLCGVAFLSATGSGDGSRTVTARFANVDGLVAGNEVRVAGVVAGSVTSVVAEVDPSTGQQYALVTLQVDASQWPLHQGANVAVKPKGVLSNMFVALDPGSSSNPSLGDHPSFALSQTESPVNLDALSNVFTPDVRTAIRTQLQEGVLAFGGAGATDLNDILVNLLPLTTDAIPVTDVLATRSPQLDSLNFEFDTITGDLAREDANLRPLITNLEVTLGAIASRETDLQGTLVHAAGVFTQLAGALSSSTTQADLARLFQQGPEALACATAIGANLNPIIAAVNPYIRSTAPYSLDTLLGDLVTASGFNTLTAKGTLPPSGDTLRVEPILAEPGNIFHDGGGLGVAHNGATNATINGQRVYAEQPAITTYPTINGCAPPPGLP